MFKTNGVQVWMVFLPRGHWVRSVSISGCHKWRVVVPASRQRPGMLLNTLLCTGQPHNKELSSPNVCSASGEKPYPKWMEQSYQIKWVRFSCCSSECPAYRQLRWLWSHGHDDCFFAYFSLAPAQLWGRSHRSVGALACVCSQIRVQWVTRALLDSAPFYRGPPGDGVFILWYYDCPGAARPSPLSWASPWGSPWISRSGHRKLWLPHIPAALWGCFFLSTQRFGWPKIWYWIWGSSSSWELIPKAWFFPSVQAVSGPARRAQSPSHISESPLLPLLKHPSLWGSPGRSSLQASGELSLPLQRLP